MTRVFDSALLHPRHWLTWLGMAFWALLVQLPYPVVMAVGAALGRLAGRLNKKRRRFVELNIHTAFADRPEQERLEIIERVFASVGMAIMETGMAWFWPKWRLRRLYRVEGADIVRDLQTQGQGVVLLGNHLSTLDVGLAFMGQEFNLDGLYRKNKNPVYDFVQMWGRQGYCTGKTIERSNLRGMVKTLRQGRSIWYAPDQDFGPEGSVFIRHFGVLTATVTATSKLAKMGKAAVVPVYQERLSDAGFFQPKYLLKFSKPLEDFAQGDDRADAQRQCDLIEALVQRIPEQYLWTQKRFKTRPTQGQDPHGDLVYR